MSKGRVAEDSIRATVGIWKEAVTLPREMNFSFLHQIQERFWQIRDGSIHYGTPSDDD